jgi:hypothetical protein
MDIASTLFYQYGAPTGISLQRVESSKPILAPGYELHRRLINMVQDKPYFQLREFEQTCACLRIEGMSDETLRWKLFLSL